MDYTIEERALTARPTAVKRFRLPIAQISEVIGPAFMETASAAGRQGHPPAGPPFARYFMTAPPAEGEPVEFEAGFPVAGPITPAGEVEPGELPGGEAIATLHVGPYDAMQPAYAAIAAWMAGHGRAPGGPPWEVYLSDPQAEPDPATWRTEVVQPLAPAG